MWKGAQMAGSRHHPRRVRKGFNTESIVGGRRLWRMRREAPIVGIVVHGRRAPRMEGAGGEAIHPI